MLSTIIKRITANVTINKNASASIVVNTNFKIIVADQQNNHQINLLKVGVITFPI